MNAFNFNKIKELIDVLEDIDDLKIDYLSWHCESHKEFLDIIQKYSQQKALVYINQEIGRAGLKRPVAIMLLKEPIKSPFGDIHTLEICSQKPDNTQKSGWSHVAFVHKKDNMNSLVELTLLFDIERKNENTLSFRCHDACIRINNNLLKKTIIDEVNSFSKEI
ncbi:MAG: putative metalloenzyme YecM [Flavobacteriaceae bacterium]|jgi:predicted metalloenzyme YecM